MGKTTRRRIYAPPAATEPDFSIPALPEIQAAIVSKICPETGDPHVFNFHDGLCDCGAYDPFVKLEDPAAARVRVEGLFHWFVDDLTDQGVDLHIIRGALQTIDLRLHRLEDQRRKVINGPAEKNQVRGS